MNSSSGGARGPLGWPPESWETVLNSTALSKQRARSINFNWESQPPAYGVPANYFALVASATIELAEGNYTLMTLADDGVRVFLDGRVVIEDWTAHPPTRNVAQAEIKGGKHYIRIEYFEATGGALLQFGILPSQNH